MSRSQLINREITKRDSKIVMNVYSMRAPTFDQIYFALKFDKIASGVTILKKRLKKLVVYNYLKYNEKHNVFSIDHKGLDIVKKRLGVVHYDYKKIPKVMFYEHNSLCNDFIINLTLACHDVGITPVSYIPEYFGAKWVELDAIYKKHRPDIIINMKYELIFVEMDNSTETLHRIMEMFEFYLQYMASGLYHVHKTEVFTVLFITDSDIRLRHIREKAVNLEYPDQYKRFILLTTKDKTNKDQILTKIWQSLNINDGDYYGFN